MAGIPYASAVESLIYAMLCTRLDICISIGIVSRYQSNPGLEHQTAVKHFLKYLRRTKDCMLTYGANELVQQDTLISMSDKDSRNSIYGHLCTLGGGGVSWRSINQKCIADSIGIVPSNYYCMLETLIAYIDISFYISLCMYVS